MTATPKKAAPASKAKRSAGASATDAAKSSPARAGAVRVRVYRQGLGDCILLRVGRPGQQDFKLLIDCGLVLGVKDKKPAEIMTSVADDVVATCEGAVDAVAITHEHWDHLSGFNQARASFKSLAVGEVWVAWTEDETDDLAKQLRKELSRAQAALALSATALHAAGDADMPEVLERITQLTGLGPMGSRGASTAEIFTAVKEAAVFKANSAQKPIRYCRPQDDPTEILGVEARIYVLGPPHDGKLIRKINPSTRTPETYGLALNGAGAFSKGVVSALTQIERALSVEDKARLGIATNLDDGMSDPESVAPFHPRMTIPLPDQDGAHGFGEMDEGNRVKDFFAKTYFDEDPWRRIDGAWLGAAPELAMAIQSYTNNTSLALALEIGPAGQGEVFLFAADAQVGNWRSWQDVKWGNGVTGPDLLARTVFYKVGHHGSHNATLRQFGLEQMTKLKFAICPVDEAEAKDKHWDRMPLPALMEALKARGVLVLRTDQTPEVHEGVTAEELFFEIGI